MHAIFDVLSFKKRTLARLSISVLGFLISLPAGVRAQEIPSLIQDVDRGYISDSNAFVAMRRVEGLEFEAQALMWTPNGLQRSGDFTVINDTAGAYTAFDSGNVVARLTRDRNVEGQTYWGLEASSGNPPQDWNIGGLRGVTNQDSEVASALIQSWERNPSSLVSLSQFEAFREVFSDAISETGPAGVLVPASEAGFLATYLNSTQVSPEVSTSIDFSGGSIAAVTMRPDQISSMASSAEAGGGQTFISYSSRNFLVSGLELVTVDKPSIFDPFPSRQQISDNQKMAFVQRFPHIATVRGCTVSRASSGAVGGGVFSCEFHSSEHRTGQSTWALMFVEFVAQQTESGKISVTYRVSFKFYQGRLDRPPSSYTDYRDETVYRMNREARETKQIGLNSVKFTLQSL